MNKKAGNQLNKAGVSTANGAWENAISAQTVTQASPKLNETSMQGETVFWLESRPHENGRNAIMMHEGGKTRCILPNPINCKSRVHEYGGGSFCVAGDTVFFVVADDQRIYRANFRQQGFQPEALSPPGCGLRFADLSFHSERNILLAVCEQHPQPASQQESHEHVKNYVVAFDLSSIEASEEQSSAAIVQPPMQVLHNDFDFYAAPRLSPDGSTLSWVSWQHPNLPWDDTQLFLAKLDGDFTLSNVIDCTRGSESIFRPYWLSDTHLLFASDLDNWWNLYVLDIALLGESIENADARKSVFKMEAEFATPQWTFNMSTFASHASGKVIATYSKDGIWHLCEIDIDKAEATTFELPFSNIYGLSASKDRASFIAASPSLASCVVKAHLNSQDKNVCSSTISHGNWRFDILPSEIKFAGDSPLKNREFSEPRYLEIPQGDDQATHSIYGFFYPPSQGDQNTLPPLIVLGHGGPTGATDNALNLKHQFWTSRGFAVLDVNYRGSTGYGKTFRRSLYGQWGIFDVEDLCTAAKYVADKGWADAKRMSIKGSSAGGFTALACLVDSNIFTVGVSLYGIGDLSILATDTHKFEARYMDQLIGPYPEQAEKYRQRSPLFSVDKITAPLLIMQGEEDKVVPPNQADKIVAAVSAKGIPVMYVSYPDEGHGFRKPENMIHSLNSELYFYNTIFNMGAELPRPTSTKFFNWEGQ